MANPDCWSTSLGTRRSARVRVYERTPGSTLHVAIWLPGDRERRTSLGHRDKTRALAEAAELLKLRRALQEGTAAPPPLMLGPLFARFVQEATHRPDGSLKTATYLQHVAKTAAHLVQFFGPDATVTDLTPHRIQQYTVWRKDGGVSGERVGTSTIQRDLGMLKAVLNWACTVYEGGQPILARNPLDKIKLPREKDPKRPILDDTEIERLLAVTPEVHASLRPLLILARRTGRRLSSILHLRWEDIDFNKRRIHWRAEYDKLRKTWAIPMDRDVYEELLRFRKASRAIGPTWLFPHPKQRRRPGEPVTRHLAAYWLKEAFRRATLEKPAGSLWHMFRRVWATERKHLPPQDVAAAGGWLDIGTLQGCYQQPDEDTLRSVVEYRRPRPTVPSWVREGVK